MTTTQPTALEIADGVDLAGRTCVITGASSGLGRESARALAATGAHVVMLARNGTALAEAQDWVQENVDRAQTSVIELDLTSLASVRSAAAAIANQYGPVHILMNNAGVMFTPFGRTEDGFEMQLGTNHLGHFELTRLLIPQLVAADGARVVILSSGGHVMGDVDPDDPNWEAREYDKFVAYGASKTANILHMVEFDKRYRDLGVRAYAVHPGVVATSLARHMSRDDFAALQAAGSRDAETSGTTIDFRTDFLMPDRGASTQVWAAVSPELEGVGSVYLDNCSISDDAAAYALDEDHAARLWELSEALCDVSRSRDG
jgi:NAD(P)-dependent dehydrogenase (short-subunit alcohol dehydrogenase family)